MRASIRREKVRQGCFEGAVSDKPFIFRLGRRAQRHGQQGSGRTR
jgi:hypothetical protein